VFRDVHRLTLQLLRDGLIDGLRIDHVDGLADPGAYLRRLRQEIGPETYLVVEKILNGEEALPSDWPVDGTTGYEFIDATIDLMADADGREALSRAYEEMTDAGPIEEARTAAKRQVLRHNFAGELDNLARLVAEVDVGSGHDEDAVREALVGLLVAMPVYRTYVGQGAAGKIDHDILQAASGAQATAASFHVFSILAGTHAQAGSDTARLARQRPGDGKGRGGHAVLSRPPPAGAQRGRLRTGQAGTRAIAVPPSHGGAGRGARPFAQRNVHPRHQAWRRRAR
jgi:maltooligosyltrehalose synthase